MIGYPNTTATSYGYDVNNRLTNLTTTQTPSGGGGILTVQEFAYSLDAEGKRTGVVEAGGGTVREYGYDSIDRLTSETVAGSLSYAKTFAYDAVGNRTSQVTTGSGAGTTPYTYDTRDRMLTSDGSTYTYDANGNELTKSGEATYTSNVENRLTSVAMAGTAGTVAYVYDADGNRVKTTLTPTAGAASVTNALVDTGAGLSQVVAETDASGNLTALYVRAGDQLLAVMRPGGSPGTWTTHFVHSDALGSVRTMTDETGAVVDTRGYEAFGTKNSEAGSETLAYGFAGEAFDSTTNLAYHRARWMDSRVGRFTGMDRADSNDVDPRTLNRYSYTRANPVTRTDPSGLLDCDVSFAAIAASLVPAGNPLSISAPTMNYSGQTFFTFSDALNSALDSAWKTSMSTFARASDQWSQDDTVMHAETGGFIFEVYLNSGGGSRYAYVSTTGYADEITTLQTLWNTGIDPNSPKDAMFHTHPNDVTYQVGQGHYVHISSDGFSPPDVQALNYFGLLSQNWAFTSYIRASNNRTYSWQFGFSAPD